MSSARRRSITTLAGLGLLALLPAPRPASGQEVTVLRHRHVVARAERIPAHAVPGSPLALRLFPDVSFDALAERVEEDPHNGLVWRGRLPEMPDSSVLLVVSDGVVAGTVRAGDHQYRIRYAGSGLHAIEEVRESADPGPADDAVAVEAVSQETGSGQRSLRQPIPAPTSEMATLDLIVFYTAAAARGAGGRRGIRSLIRLDVAFANRALDNSRIKARLRLVGMRRVPYREADAISDDLLRLRVQGDGFLDQVHRRRDRVGADLVSLYRARTPQESLCGMGYLGWSQLMLPDADPSATAFSVVRTGCPEWVLAHELGHNMGLLHARSDYPDSQSYDDRGAFPYSYGYRRLAPGASFQTVMANSCPGCRRLPHFSNPRIRVDGARTGVRRSRPDAADAAHSVNRLRDALAGHRPCRVDCGEEP